MHKYLISNILHILSIFLRSSGEQARSYQTYNKYFSSDLYKTLPSALNNINV